MRGVTDSRPKRIPLLGWVFAMMGFVPTAACLGVGVWLLLVGRAFFGVALVAAAVVIEIGLRLWVRTLRRWRGAAR